MDQRPTYEELEARIKELEEIIEVLRKGQVDILMGEGSPFVLKTLHLQRALEESEERFRSLCKVLSDYAYSFKVNPDGTLEGEWVTESFVKAFGFTKEEIDARGGWQSMVYAEDLPVMVEHGKKVAGGLVDVVEARFVTRWGEVRWIRDHAMPAWDREGKRVVRIYGAAKDITEEKRAIEALERSKANLEALIETADALIVIVDPQGKITLFNRACEELTGYRREEVLGRPLVETFVPPGWQEVVRERFKDPMSEPLRLPHENPWLTKSGEERLIEWRCSAIPSSDGKGFVVIGVGVDITERKKLEDALRETSYRLHHILSTSPIVLYTLVPEGNGWKATWVSGNIEEVTGYTPDEALEPGWWKRNLHPEDREAAIEAERVLFHQRSLTHRYRIRRKDGSYMWVRDDIRVLRDEKGNPVEAIGAWVEITDFVKAQEEKAKLEAQLQQAQKMEAIGRLAGGIAHDFNNMLTIIKGYGQLVLERLREDDPLYADIQEIMNAAERSENLTRQLLAFSRRQMIRPRPLDLNLNLQGIEKLLSKMLGEDISLNLVLADDLWTVYMDPSQVDQVVANLAVNARDAMPKGGSLIIETGNVLLDQDYCTTHPGSIPGEHVLLAFTDTGCGMDKDTMEKAFEPFFTTKKDGEGTGLGLSTVYGIVKQNGGLVNLYSEPGMGTTVKIYIPRYSGEPGAQEDKRPGIGVERGKETILLVEDEPSLRALTKKMLETMGYTVLDAGNPSEAMKIAEGYPGEIHLLLTDVILPETDGKELSQGIKAMRPNIKVLFMSGYASNVIAQRGVLPAEVQFLEKPFSHTRLSQKVREALERG